MAKDIMKAMDGASELMEGFEDFLEILPYQIVEWGEENDVDICVVIYNGVNYILDDEDYVEFRKALGAELISLDKENYYYRYKDKVYGLPYFEMEDGDICLDFYQTFEATNMK